jgi:hypothetical protein
MKIGGRANTMERGSFGERKRHPSRMMLMVSGWGNRASAVLFVRNGGELRLANEE